MNKRKHQQTTFHVVLQNKNAKCVCKMPWGRQICMYMYVYEHVQGFMEDLYSNPAVSSTVDFGQIKTGYWWSMNLHGPLNPKDRLPLNSEPFTPKVCVCLFMCS